MSKKFPIKNNVRELQNEYLQKNNGVIKCKCGHSIEFLNYSTKYKLCTYCGNYVFRNKKEEFDYRMKGILKR